MAWASVNRSHHDVATDQSPNPTVLTSISVPGRRRYSIAVNETPKR